MLVFKSEGLLWFLPDLIQLKFWLQRKNWLMELLPSLVGIGQGDFSSNLIPECFVIYGENFGSQKPKL